ncbi:MAG: hypothetical protein QMB03_09110, partial [Spirosomataceae bacterium]
MTQVIDKESLKAALRELIREEPTFIKDIISETEKSTKIEKRLRLERIVEEDFTEYDEVFKA